MGWAEQDRHIRVLQELCYGSFPAPPLPQLGLGFQCSSSGIEASLKKYLIRLLFTIIQGYV